MYTDTHTHLYLDAFSGDLDAMVGRALEAGVTRMLLPHIDRSTTGAMFSLAERYPGICLPMMGLHLTSVKDNYREVLAEIRKQLDSPGVVAVGEIGIDLYWDRTFVREQEEAFRRQLAWARERELPVVIHARDSFEGIFSVMDQEGTEGMKGVFHSFSGSEAVLKKALSYGFMIGINGIVTFKNSGLAETVSRIPLDRLLLETDAPFLAPHPHRGKRNESSYLPLVAQRVGEIFNLTGEAIGQITARNAQALFQQSS